MRNRLKQKQKRKKPSSADIYIQQMTHVNELVVQLLQYARPTQSGLMRQLGPHISVRSGKMVAKSANLV